MTLEFITKQLLGFRDDMPKTIYAKRFERATRRRPILDNLKRCNCRHVGEPGAFTRGRTLALIAALVALIAAGPAYACRRFSIWHFPWPQRCSAPKPVEAKAPAPDGAIPLPDLTPITGETPDDETRPRLIMRAKGLDR
jgi:hypothetical protein